MSRQLYCIFNRIKIDFTIVKVGFFWGVGLGGRGVVNREYLQFTEKPRVTLCLLLFLLVVVVAEAIGVDNLSVDCCLSKLSFKKKFLLINKVFNLKNYSLSLSYFKFVLRRCCLLLCCW